MIELRSLDRGVATYAIRSRRSLVHELGEIAARHFPGSGSRLHPFPDAWTLFANEKFATEAYAAMEPEMAAAIRGLLERHGPRLRLLFEWRGWIQ